MTYREKHEIEREVRDVSTGYKEPHDAARHLDGGRTQRRHVEQIMRGVQSGRYSEFEAKRKVEREMRK